jgi:hypothetical protein
MFVIGCGATANYRADGKLHSDPLPFVYLPVYFSPFLSLDAVEVISVTAYLLTYLLHGAESFLSS